MRSRYTAYVLRNSAYLLKTWDYSSRPTALSLETDSTTWLGLEIHEAPLTEKDAVTGSVHFTAVSMQDGKQVIMNEKSRFVKKKGLWYYLNGELQVTEKEISLKSRCPCGSGKKYKRCCAVEK